MRLTSNTGQTTVFDEAEFESLFEQRIAEADEFYKSIYPPRSAPDDRAIMRQALAGMLWTKQFYYFDLDLWLREHGYNPTGLGRHPPGYAARYSLFGREQGGRRSRSQDTQEVKSMRGDATDSLSTNTLHES
jgi:hypothetical protein